MYPPQAVAFCAFAGVRPRATEKEIGAALCAIGAETTLAFDFRLYLAILSHTELNCFVV